MKTNRKRPASFRAMTLRISALVLALWLACMGLLTWAVASDMYLQLESQTREYAFTVSGREKYTNGNLSSLPGTMEIAMVDHLGYPYYFLNVGQLLPIVLPQTPSSYSSSDWIWGKWDLLYGFEAAVIFYKEDGEILMESGNYLTFTYTGEENWATGEPEALGYAYVDLDETAGGMDAFENLLSDSPGGSFGTRLFLPLLRLTGYFQGSAFHPTAIDRGAYYTGGAQDPKALSILDAQGEVDWEDLLTLEEVPGQSSETIYAWDVGGILCDYDDLTMNGTHFDTLTELLRADYEDLETDYSRKSLLDSVILYRTQQEDAYGPYVYAIAVRCWPLQYAAFRLIYVYLISFAAAALCVYLVLRRLRRSLTEPLERLTAAISRGTTITPAANWAEPRQLEEYFTAARQELAEAKAELQQARTALDYAKDAEENRRQLVSNMTHELKTPLAVIHSYAESLQAGVAGDQQDQYLAVIQEEAEKMDAMVLQMLDLSRLEAGKVRLSSDAFSLIGLTQAVLEKFTPMLEQKALTLQRDFGEDFLITADEGRIEQVITNLVSNAVKYTPQGGSIYVKISMDNRSARFFIENTAQPLSAEALERVWDSFYRADPSRTEPGTGLGLTIVKRIVELHQGTCSVHNITHKTGASIPTGVAFGFTLPMG